MHNVLGAAVVALALIVAPAAAQQAAAPTAVPRAPLPPPVSSVPVPSTLELSKLVWSTMAAVDNANQAGNYSVVRDMSAPGFQANFDAARLAQIFANVRAIDLSNTLLLAPTFTTTPRLVQPGILQLKGFFGLRPTAISFELLYQWVGGRWKLFGVSILPSQIATQQPAPRAAAPAPVAQQQPPKRRSN